MVPGNPYYAVTLSDLRLGGSSLGFGAAAFGPALVDMGTTAIVLPNAVFSALTKAVAAEPVFAQNFRGGASWFTGGFCDTPAAGLSKAALDAGLPKLALAFPSSTGGTFTVDLPATESYLLQQDDDTGTAYYCPGVEPPGSGAQTVIGASGLQSQLTVFDRQNEQIGFAPEQGCAAPSDIARLPLEGRGPSSRPAPSYRHRVQAW